MLLLTFVILYANINIMYTVVKVETVGDAYTCASGVPDRNPNHAEELADMALAVRIAVTEIKVSCTVCELLKIAGCYGKHCSANLHGVLFIYFFISKFSMQQYHSKIIKYTIQFMHTWILKDE